MDGMLADGRLLTTLAALVFVLALIGVARWVLRVQRRGAGGNRRLALTETTALDARRRLHLVRCDDRYVLIQTGGAADMVVGWLPPVSS